MFDTIIKEADALQEELRDQRRDLHRHAEQGWLEIYTSAVIARKLTDLGYEVLTGDQVCGQERLLLPTREELEEGYRRALEQGADPHFAGRARDGYTGVIGILNCGEGPVLALRFDIDALSQQEACDDEHLPHKLGFDSVNSGSMHACGHDGHATIGLGVAQLLMRHRDQLHGTVKLIFQPAEEGLRGAKAIIAKGHLDDVDYVVASHLCRPVPADSGVKVSIGSGRSLATYKFDVDFQGRAAHAGAAPQMGNNALLAACTAALNLHAIPRHSLGTTRVNVGRITGGNNRNTVCGSAKIEAEVRANTPESIEFLMDYSNRIVAAAAQMHGCEAKVTMLGAAPTSVNSPALKARIGQVCIQKLGLETELSEKDLSASEDFTFMVQHVLQKGGQACYVTLPTAGSGSFHNVRFDFDESVLATGVKMFCGTALSLLGDQPL